MKKFIILIFISFISLCGFSQQSQNNMLNDEDVYITMTLNSVIEYMKQGEFYIKISNTENVLISFCEKIIKVQPGIHRIYVEVDNVCEIMVIEANSVELERMASSFRIIPNGMENINPITGEFTKTDYIEYTVCDYLFYNRQY